ncbi:MAG: hypothetical protein LH702_36975 [Phormidesmis sp. CAN_BIN44]|nr:hypothetical protein [Phormidesmis sp. CAN_BIN44]
MNLIEQFLTSENFQIAWDRVRQNNGCARVDGETVSQFGRNAGAYLEQLRYAVATHRYRPLPLRQLFIPQKAIAGQLQE